MIFSKLKKLYISYWLPLAFAGIFLTAAYSPERDILHGENIAVSPYNDGQSGGNSTITCQVDDLGNIAYTFNLGDSIPFPYAGVMVHRKDSSFMDLSGYNSLSIKSKVSNDKGVIPVYIFSNIEGYSSWEMVLSFLNIQSIMPVDTKERVSEIAFSDFHLPTWWIENQRANSDINIDEDIKPDLKQVAIINLANFGNAKKYEDYTVYITEITAIKNMFAYYLYTATLLALYYILLFGTNYYARKNKSLGSGNKQVTFSYEKIHIEDGKDATAEIFEQINTNYYNQELSIADLQHKTGYSERKISQIIKDKTDLSFKQYLNNIRMSEAKRLLSETDLQISEIAYKIGYNNVTHFNRVFKTLENISPTNYRSQINVDK